MTECFVVVPIETNSTTLNFDYFVVAFSERYISLMRGENYFYKHFWTEYMNGVNLWMNDNVCLEISRLYTRIECSWSGLFIWKCITFKSSQISIKNWLGRYMPHACNLSVYLILLWQNIQDQTAMRNEDQFNPHLESFKL